MAAYGLCYCIYVCGIKASTMIEINGSVVGFLYIFLIPIMVHIMCEYFRPHDEVGYMLMKKDSSEYELLEE